MPFFSNFGSKKKSKSSSNLTPSDDPGYGSNQQSNSWVQQNQQWVGQNQQWNGHNQQEEVIQSLEANNAVTRLEKKNKELEEENNMLKLKIEILLDMLAQKTAETSLQESELERLQTTVEMMSPSRLRLI